MFLLWIENDITKYLTIKECNTLRWNMDKINKAVSDKKMLDKVYDEVYTEGFVSCKELKERFKIAFNKYGITLAPKASLIESCNKYTVIKKCKRVNTKPTKGYILSR